MRHFLFWISTSVIGFAGCSGPAALRAAPVTHSFRPNQTDAAISTFDNVQFAVLDSEIPTRGQLFLFLPGTGASPFYYQLILQAAAAKGYYVLGLMYPNATSTNDLCTTKDSCDCAARIRFEILDGIDRTPKVSVDRANSIENRLIKALLYLQANYPAENWLQFLDAQGGIVWEKIAISGHSQGAGHAAFIAKQHLVARAVMFAGLDWCRVEGRPSDWVFGAGITPVNHYFGFLNANDQLTTLPAETQMWNALGISGFGLQVDVDATPPPYTHSHQLTTRVQGNLPGDPRSYHGSIVVDLFTPLNPDGTAVLKPVWDYLLTEEPTPRSAVVSLQKVGSMVTLSADSFSGHTYQLQRSLSLSDQLFENLGVQRAGLTGTNLEFVDGAAPSAKAFYRIAVDP